MDGRDDFVTGHVTGTVVTYLLHMWKHFIQILLNFLTQQICSQDLDTSTHLHYIFEVKNFVSGHVSVAILREDSFALKDHHSMSFTNTQRAGLAPIGGYYLSTFIV